MNVTAAPWEPQSPENTGLVPRETFHGDHEDGQEGKEGRQVLIAQAAQLTQLPIDSRRLPLPSLDDRFSSSPWS